MFCHHYFTVLEISLLKFLLLETGQYFWDLSLFFLIRFYLFCCGWGTDLEVREQLVTVLFFVLWS